MAVEDAFVPYSTMTAPPMMDAEVVVEEAVVAEEFETAAPESVVIPFFASLPRDEPSTIPTSPAPPPSPLREPLLVRGGGAGSSGTGGRVGEGSEVMNIAPTSFPSSLQYIGPRGYCPTGSALSRRGGTVGCGSDPSSLRSGRVRRKSGGGQRSASLRGDKEGGGRSLRSPFPDGRSRRGGGRGE